METFPDSLASFFDTQRQRYGEFFWYDTLDTGNGTARIIVMLESIARRAREACDDPRITIVSFENEETLGDFYRVQKDGTAFHTLPLREQEQNAYQDKANPGKGDERFVWRKDVMQGELVRCYQPHGYDAWYAAAAYHSFGTRAPRAMGWMHQDDMLQRLGQKAFARPDVLQDFAAACKSLEHVPYCMGGKSREHGFDCSGLVQYIAYYTKGLWLPRQAAWQALVCAPVAREDIQQGDLVFFKKTGQEHIDHVACVFQPQQGKLPVIFHAKKLAGESVFDDLDVASWLGQWDISGYGRVTESVF